MKNKLRIKKMDQAREREKGRQPVGWARRDNGVKIEYVSIYRNGSEKINLARSLNPEE